MIFFDRKNLDRHYYEIKDQKTVNALNTQHRLLESDIKQVSNPSAPLIFGSVTQNNLCQMADISLFNLFLDNRKIRKEFGAKNSQNVLNSVINMSQGIKLRFGKSISTLSQDDWVRRFMNNLPYPKNDMLICNLDLDEESQALLNDPKYKSDEDTLLERQKNSQEDIFVFAGFIKPDKH